MSNESIKSQIIKGARASDIVYVEELNLEIPVRPLTDAESSEAAAAALRGQKHHVDPRKGKIPTDLEFDIPVSAEGQAEARRIKAAYGMSVGNEKWTPKEVGKHLSSSAVRTIAKKVDELTGGDDQASVAREFRELVGGSVDSEAASAGDATGDNAG